MNSFLCPFTVACTIPLHLAELRGVKDVPTKLQYFIFKGLAFKAFISSFCPSLSSTNFFIFLSFNSLYVFDVLSNIATTFFKLSKLLGF